MSRERRKVERSLDLEHLNVRAGQFVTGATGGRAETRTASLSEALDNAERARIEIAFPVGQASITALAPGSPNLFEAELTYVGEYEFDVIGAAERVISLRQRCSVASELGALAGRARDLRWDISLARGLPIRLGIAAGVGEAEIDLGGLHIEALRLETGVGKTLVKLPAPGTPLAARIRGGVGITEVMIPAAAFGELDIKGGLGAVHICASPSLAARVEAKAGLGAIELPPTFARVSGENTAKSRLVWQSADYADAEQSIIIRYQGGVGRFKLETAD
ncbi:MAG: hypothetical protein F4X02_10805 [Chloroflexi bacterium]|nr:hypothetical protein [Chloroflexota bacterium]